jgi:rubrerythrin
MNYSVIDNDSPDDDNGLIDESLHTILQDVKLLFEPENGDVEIAEDDKYLKCFQEFKEDYKNSMKIYLENSKTFEKKREMTNAIVGFSLTMAKKTDGKYVSRIKDLVNEFVESEKLEELKKDLENSEMNIRKLFKISSLTKDLSMNNEYYCFICLERGIDTMIEPCGHVICESCSKGAIQQCPFCRANINSFKKLIIG